jgi:hypothetical protein
MKAVNDEPQLVIGRGEDQEQLISQRRYRKILIAAVLSVSVVAVAPLLIMTGINYHQYQEAFRAEATRPMVRFAANGKLSLESFRSPSACRRSSW